MTRPESSTLPLRILIAEDDSINQRLMSFHLKAWQNNLLFANDGVEALELFKENNIGLVLMDVRMPRMGGVEATREILELDPEAKVIALSAFAQEENNFDPSSVGFVDYMTKPIRKDELIAIVKKYLG